MKNIGDYLMTLGDALLAVHALGTSAKIAAGVTAVASGVVSVLSLGTTQVL